jgi:cytochrome c-type biogenesis protein CcmH
MRRALAIALLIGVMHMQVAVAIDSAPAFADPVQQARYNELIHQLRCVQCRGQSIADSNVSLAADLRRQVRELMAAAQSDAQILEYMTARYGDYVLYDPPLKPQTWLLWAAPLLFVTIGGITAVIVILRKSRLSEDDPAETDPALVHPSDAGAP